MNYVIEQNTNGPTAGSVQQRKRRQIMHDNLTNSRGTNRQSPNPQIYDFELSMGQNRQGVGIQSPPTLPQQQIRGQFSQYPDQSMI
jgi:hypothetical protein